jgi:hypothetical protein
MYPFMAYSSGMSGLLCVIGTGLLTLGYQGLVSIFVVQRTGFSTLHTNQFDLAKQFLDPYDNENYGKGEDPLVVDTLIAETNAGSVRWMNGLETMPVSNQRIRDGDLDDFILPVRGYSLDELAVMEKERKERQEKKERKEQQRRQSEERKKRINDAARALIPYHRASERVDSAAPRRIMIDGARPVDIDYSCHIDTPLKVVKDVVDLINDQSMMQSLQNELIPAGTALASSFVEMSSLPTNDIEPQLSSSMDMGILDNDGIDVDPNLFEEEILLAMEREREKLKLLEELHQNFRAITSAKQSQSDAHTTTGQVGKQVVVHQGGLPSADRKESYSSTNATSANLQQEAPNAGSPLAPDLPVSVSGDQENPIVPSVPSLEVPVLSRDSSRVQLGDDTVKDNTIEEDDDEGDDVKPENAEMFTFEDYERKVQKLLDMEKEELLETEAILNAGPGVDIELPEKERNKDSLTNSTALESASFPDQLDPNSINADFNDDNNLPNDETLDEARDQPEGSQVQAQETSVDKQLSDPAAMMNELLETEAILNARPGADGFECTDKERNSGLIVNATRADDLAILEMDEPPSPLIANPTTDFAVDFPIAELAIPTTMVRQNETQSNSIDGSSLPTATVND